MAESLVTLEEADVEDLPPFARELVALIGFGATIRLVELRPGVPLYIPCEVHPDHSLALALGMNAAAALVKNYGGITITPPNCKVAMVKIRRGCKKFCVNGHLAGDCRPLERSRNDRSKATTTLSGADRQPAVWL